VVVPFYLAAQLNQPALAWLALGGWLGALADPTGTRRARALAMAVFVIASSAVIAIAGSLAHQPIAAALFIAVVGFTSSFARAINGPAGVIGTLVMLIAAIAGAGTDSPLEAAGLFAGGAVWAVGLSSIVWPGWPHLPLRIALAKAYGELPAYCDALAAAAQDPAADWSAVDAIQRYVELTFEIVPTDADRAPLAAARRATGIAFENAEVSLERMLAEPKPLRRGNADAAVLLTYGRRLAAALTALDEARRDERPVMPDFVKHDVTAALAQARAHITAGTTIERSTQPPVSVQAPLDKLVHYAALVRQIAYA